MSTLKVTNIQDTAGDNSSTSAEIYQGRAKAWCLLGVPGGTVSILGDYNISTVTDNGVGSFTFNFSTALSSGNYAAPTSISADTGVTWGDRVIMNHAVTDASVPNSTTSYRIRCGGGTRFDPDYVHTAVFGVD